MARKTTTQRGKQPDKPKYQCRHCKHSYDWCSKALDGHFILCRCPFYKEGNTAASYPTHNANIS